MKELIKSLSQNLETLKALTLKETKLDLLETIKQQSHDIVDMLRDFMEIDLDDSLIMSAYISKNNNVLIELDQYGIVNLTKLLTKL